MANTYSQIYIHCVFAVKYAFHGKLDLEHFPITNPISQE